MPDGLSAYEAVLAPMTGDEGSTAGRVWMAKSWLQIVVDDLDGVPSTLAEVAPAQLRNGSIRIAVWSYVWLSRAHYLLGGWDDATAAAERAVSLLEETGHEWLRPLARWVAVSVFAGRGEWSCRGGARAAGVGRERRLRADDRVGRTGQSESGVGARRPRASAAGA